MASYLISTSRSSTLLISPLKLPNATILNTQKTAKDPYAAVSARGYETQITRYLDRQEKIMFFLFFFDRYLAWRLENRATSEDVTLNLVSNEGRSMLNAGWFDAAPRIDIPTSTYDAIVSKTPHLNKTDIGRLSEIFLISTSSFYNAVRRYEARLEYGSGAWGSGWAYMTDEVPDCYRNFDVWTLFKIQLPLLDELHEFPEIRIIRAQPTQ